MRGLIPSMLGCESLALAGSLCVSLLGCESRPLPREATVRDSAGITLVSVVTRRQSRIDVDPLPAVSIGLVEGPPQYLFADLRGIWVTPSGVIVAVDGGSDEVRVFGSDGRYVETFGRKGRGPNEFVALDGPWVIDDTTAFVYDRGNRRATLLNEHGMPVGSRALASAESFSPIGVLHDSLLVGVEPDLGEINAAAALRDFSGDVVGETWSGDVKFRVGPVPLTERVMVRRGRAIFFLKPPNPRVTQFALVDSEVVVGTQRTPDILVYAGSRQRMVIRFPNSNAHGVLPNRSDDSLVNAVLRRSDPRPPPFYGAIATDPSDRLWVESTSKTDGGGSIWVVVNLHDGSTATVGFPTDLAVRQITRTQIAGIVTDSLGVATIQVYPLPRTLSW